MMKTVKAEWDKAPAGPKKDAALKHYQAAEAALKAHNERGCIAALKSAGSALTWFGAHMEVEMEWNRVEESWKQVKREIKEQASGGV